MVQHKVKQKVTLPQGVGNSKGGRVKKAQGPKKGQKLQLKSKSPKMTPSAKLQVAVTKEINRANEQLIKERADCSTSGPKSKPKK